MAINEMARELPRVYWVREDLTGIHPSYYSAEFEQLTGRVPGVGIHQGIGASGSNIYHDEREGKLDPQAVYDGALEILPADSEWLEGEESSLEAILTCPNVQIGTVLEFVELLSDMHPDREAKYHENMGVVGLWPKSD